LYAKCWEFRKSNIGVMEREKMEYWSNGTAKEEWSIGVME
jgi:hypothetical protein